MASTTTTGGASSTTVLATTTTLGVSPTSEETLPVTGIEYQWSAYLGLILVGIGLAALLALVMSQRTDTDQQRDHGIQRPETPRI
jgi:LPXTG-motif cell wall-anchored protein